MTAEQALTSYIWKHFVYDMYHEDLPDLLPEVTGLSWAEALDLFESAAGEKPWDAMTEARGLGEPAAGLGAPYSRYFECEMRAVKVAPDCWVGYPYWYGGGKHAQPEQIDWVPDAQFVKIAREEKIVRKIFEPA